MVCDEVWDYNDEAGVANLVDFALSCWRGLPRALWRALTVAALAAQAKR